MYSQKDGSGKMDVEEGDEASTGLDLLCFHCLKDVGQSFVGVDRTAVTVAPLNGHGIVAYGLNAGGIDVLRDVFILQFTFPGHLLNAMSTATLSPDVGWMEDESFTVSRGYDDAAIRIKRDLGSFLASENQSAYFAYNGLADGAINLRKALLVRLQNHRGTLIST